MTKNVHVRAARSLRNENRRIAALPEPIRDWYRRGWLTPSGRLRKHIARNPRDRAMLRRRLLEHLVDQAAPAVPERRIRRVRCKFCRQLVDSRTAHRHDGGYVGDECCWDERLRASA